MADVLHKPVLVLEAVLDFHFHIPVLFFELADSVNFNIFNLELLPLKFFFQLGGELKLPLLAALLLNGDCLFDLVTFLLEQLQDLPFLLDPSVPLDIQIIVAFVDALIYGLELIV